MFGKGIVAPQAFGEGDARDGNCEMNGVGPNRVT